MPSPQKRKERTSQSNINYLYWMEATRKELEKRYATWDNARLLTVVRNPNEYTAVALEAAEAELSRRNVSRDELETFIEETTQQTAEKQARLDLASRTPLSLIEKGFYYFFWWIGFFIAMAFRANYIEDGMLLKLRQSKMFSVAGFASTLLISSVFTLLDWDGSLGLITWIVSFFAFMYFEKRMQ